MLLQLLLLLEVQLLRHSDPGVINDLRWAPLQRFA